MAGPWDKYAAPQQAPQPVQQQPQQPQTPGVIMGRQRTPDPYRVQQDQINNQQEAERLRIAQESANLGRQKDELDIAKKQREAAAGPAGDSTESERKAASFLGRAVNAESNYLNVDADPAKRGQQQIGGRSVPGQFISETFPNIANEFADQPRQLADQAQREFIAAVLRYDSGAAIPTEEFVTNARIYFPQPGDGPDVIRQKAETRRTAIAGLRDSAGRMAPQASASPETAAEVAQWAGSLVAPAGSAATPGDSSPPQGPTGNFANTANTDALGPGEKFLFDETGTPIAIQAADGSISGYSAIVDDISEREAREALEAQGGMGYAEGGQAGLYRGVSLGLSDEILGIGAGINSAIRGEGFGEGYRRERDVERAAQDISRDEAGILPELAGGLLAPAGVLGQAKNVGQFVRQGAALGSASGFGEGEGAVNSLLGAGGGAAVGGALGGALSQAPRAVNALLGTGPGQRVASSLAGRRSAGVNREVVEAGQRQNIPIRQPDARPETRNAFAAVEASPTQSAKVRTVLDGDVEAIRGRLNSVAGDGTRLDNTSMGEAVQGAGTRYIAKSGAQANALYRRAEEATGDARFTPEQALKAIDDNIAELSANGPRANRGQIAYLEDLKSDLSRGDLSIGQLRSIRTGMRGQINERNLTATDAERRVGQVIDAASADIQRGLASNPQAQAAYKAADDFYREKQTFIKDVVQRFTGTKNAPLSAEQAASKFQAMMRDKGDYKRFSAMLGKLDPTERSDMAASIAETLGTGRNGEFSLAGLATNVSKMNPRALRDLFGADGAKAIADLRVIARAKADTQSGLNLSKSGVVMAANNQFKDVLLGALGGGMGGVPGAMGGMAARGAVEGFSSARAAKLLLNPDFTKWLRQTPSSTSPAVINRHFDRLNKLASREQSFLMDAKALQEYLRNAASQTPSRAAAESQQEQDRR